MTGATTAFGIAVGGTSLICCALMTRLQSRRVVSRSSRDRSGSGEVGYAGDDGGSHFGHSAPDSSGNPSDAGGGDSGGGEYGGGGDGGDSGGGSD
ncbi:MAG: hypothetical protein JWP25_3450 [Bradyrhizobium sp.]|nr:hypothetical protein [Bradyrhizobium sp.]MEA2869326.1 hypothetical protein [Bradyrhizobium sp.]